VSSNPRSVLLDTRQKNWKQNPYTSLLAESIEPESVALGFTWTRALFGKYEVAHVHWPEYLLKHRTKIGSIAAKLLFLAWMLRLRIFQIPVLKTMHNRKPHDNYGRIHKRILRRFESLYSVRLWLMPPPEGISQRKEGRDVVIPHGDYHPWLDALGVRESEIRAANLVNGERHEFHLLCFGVLKKYKNIHEPVSAVVSCTNPRVRLAVKGMATDFEYFNFLKELAADDPRIEILAERLEDDQLIAEILATDVVVIPYPDLYNSGVLLLALSLGRPVALRTSDVALEFQAEFGADWIMMYDNEFDADALEELIARYRSPHSRHVSETRNWNNIGGLHNEAYTLASGT
jgi:beta-1,4-mannosyltransferase